LQWLVTKNGLDARQKLDEATTEIIALKWVVTRLQKTVEQLEAAQKAAGDKKAGDQVVWTLPALIRQRYAKAI
jgi:hypothetical protein